MEQETNGNGDSRSAKTSTLPTSSRPRSYGTRDASTTRSAGHERHSMGDSPWAMGHGAGEIASIPAADLPNSRDAVGRPVKETKSPKPEFAAGKGFSVVDGGAVGRLDPSVSLCGNRL